MSSTRKRGATVPIVVTALVVIVAAVAITLTIRRGDAAGSSNTGGDTFEVRVGDFDITVPASGELAAEKQEEIRNRLETRSATIMEIIGEGEHVTAGQVILRMNDEEIREWIQEQSIDLMDSRNATETAQSNLDLVEQERDAAIKDANVQVELAELALKVWEEGEEVSMRRGLELQIETAEKNFTRLSDVYENSVGLEEQKFISLDELRRAEISMIEARASLEQARLDLQVYEDHQYEHDRKTKESDLQQAQDKLQQVTDEYDSKVRMAQNDLAARQSNLEQEEQQFEKYQRHLEHCTVTAPCDGLVVYASSLSEGRHGRSEGQPPQVGTDLSRNELVMIIPDVSQMVAEVKVPEALSGQIKPGQRVVVKSDAVPDTPIHGEVISVGVLAESGGWRDPNRRDYTVRVRLDANKDLGLKPSMRCTADIYVGRVDDTVHVPIQSVHRKGPISYVYVPKSGGWAQQPVTIGRTSELYTEVLEGLDAGEVVLLREPRVEEITSVIEVDVSTPRGWGSGAGGGMPSGAGGGEASRGSGRPSGEGRSGRDRRGGGGGQPGGATSAPSTNGGGHTEAAPAPAGAGDDASS